MSLSVNRLSRQSTSRLTPSFSRVSLTSKRKRLAVASILTGAARRRRLTVSGRCCRKRKCFGELDEIIRIHDIDRPVYVDLDPDTYRQRAQAGVSRDASDRCRKSSMMQRLSRQATHGASIGFEFTQVL